MAYLIHFNKNHSSKDGRFVSGDGDGDGQLNDNSNRSKKKGVYSAKIDNYRKGTLFNDPYYIDKKGKKRSYMSYKEMPVEAQRAEKARANGKAFVKKAGKFAGSIAAGAAIAVGTGWLTKKIYQFADDRKIDWR